MTLLSHLDTFHKNEEVEMAVREWMLKEQSDLHSDSNFILVFKNGIIAPEFLGPEVTKKTLERNK